MLLVAICFSCSPLTGTQHSPTGSLSSLTDPAPQTPPPPCSPASSRTQHPRCVTRGTTCLSHSIVPLPHTIFSLPSLSLPLTPFPPHSPSPSLPPSFTPSPPHPLSPSLPLALTPSSPHSLFPSLLPSLPLPSPPLPSLSPSLLLPLTPSPPHSLSSSLLHPCSVGEQLCLYSVPCWRAPNLTWQPQMTGNAPSTKYRSLPIFSKHRG